MKIANINNNFKGSYKIIGLKNPEEINKKYSNVIQRKLTTIQNNNKEIERLAEENKSLNADLIELETTRAILNQALYHMEQLKIHEKIAELPENETITFHTTLGGFISADLPFTPFLSRTNNSENNQVEDFYTFEINTKGELDTDTLNAWLDNA